MIHFSRYSFILSSLFCSWNCSMMASFVIFFITPETPSFSIMSAVMFVVWLFPIMVSANVFFSVGWHLWDHSIVLLFILIFQGGCRWVNVVNKVVNFLFERLKSSVNFCFEVCCCLILSVHREHSIATAWSSFSSVEHVLQIHAASSLSLWFVDILLPSLRTPFLPEASFGLRVLSSPLSVYLSVCVCINHLLVRTITHQPFKLESPNLKYRCKTPWLRCLLFWGVIDLELQGQIERESRILPHLSLSAR